MIHLYKRLWYMAGGLLLFMSAPAIAQDLQLTGFSFTRFPEAEVMGSPSRQEVTVNEYNLFLNIPAPLKNGKTILVHRFQYRLAVPTAAGDPNVGGQHLHVIDYRFTALHQLRNEWRILVSLNPTLSSAFDTALEKDDFLFNGALLFVKKKSDRLSYGGGIAYTSRFGEPGLLPALQLTYRTGNNKLQVLLPRSITYDHYIGKLTVGMQLAANGSHYKVSYTKVNGSNTSVTINRLAYTRVVIGPVLSYRVGKVIQLEASGGITVARRIGLQGDHMADENYDFARGPFFRFGIALVAPKKDNRK